MSKIRGISQIVLAKEHQEGEGAVIWCSIGRGKLLQVDPFLLLDHADVKPPAGFPDHPHRGFETVSYLLKGSFVHEDFAGHKATIHEGDVQWMTAGRGIFHSEVPGPDGGEGLQLWVNLAKVDKMVEPAYQDLKKKNIPSAKQGGIAVSVIAGESLGVKSPIKTRTPTTYLDFTLAPGARLMQSVEPTWNAFVYVISGNVTLGSEGKQQEFYSRTCVVFAKEGDCIQAINKGNAPARFVLIAGKPLDEPVARQGPIVMNTYDEVKAAFDDFRGAKNGFEKARNWKSAYMRSRRL